VTLSPEEKRAGRKFRDDQVSLLKASHETNPPTFIAPSYIRIFRHSCPGNSGASTEIFLREVYNTNPDMYEDRIVGDPRLVLREGTLAFIYKEGKCKLCGATARSKTGRIVETSERPPLSRR
jgi:hypothetical protein